jgi:hypothetical protein
VTARSSGTRAFDEEQVALYIDTYDLQTLGGNTLRTHMS